MLPKFSSPKESHENSLKTLDELNQYDSFMSSIDTVVDMGCGIGLDAFWWASRRDPMPPHIPRDYNCIAVDNKVKRLSENCVNSPNLTFLKENFENTSIKESSVDVIWCHDSFQYAKDPLNTLKHWNKLLAPNGMIYLCLPYTVNRQYNKFSGKLPSGVLYHHMPSSIIFLLAAIGFDCSDQRIAKFAGENFFHIVAYKDEEKAVNEYSTWYELVETDRLPPSAVSMINKTGYLDDYELEGVWFNGSRYTFDKQ